MVIFPMLGCLTLVAIMQRLRKMNILEIRTHKIVKTMVMKMKWKVTNLMADTVFFVLYSTSVGRGSSMALNVHAITHPLFCFFLHILHSHIILASFSLSLSLSYFIFLKFFFFFFFLDKYGLINPNR